MKSAKKQRRSYQNSRLIHITVKKAKKNQSRSKKRDKSMQGEKRPNCCKTQILKKSCQHCRLPRV